MIGTLSLDDLARIRRMSRTDAESYISSHTLEPADKEIALSLAGKSINEQPPHIPKGQIFDSSRRVWFLAAWLAGASWRQLAWLHDISPQTILSSASRLMTSDQRSKIRLKSKISPEALSAYRAHFLNQTDRLKDMSPLMIATEFITLDTDTSI